MEKKNFSLDLSDPKMNLFCANEMGT